MQNLATTGMIGQNTSSRNLNSDILEYQSIRLLLSPLEVSAALMPICAFPAAGATCMALMNCSARW